MLLELAIADAYGVGFEDSDPAFVLDHNDLSAYVQNPHYGIKPGCYTDNTQMSIAIAEMLVTGLPWTQEFLANSFVMTFKRDPRFGYASGFYDFLRHVQDGNEFLAQIRPYSKKSGAAIRAIPIGVLSTPDKVIKATITQAAITHNTPDGINAALAAALMSHYFLYRLGKKADLRNFLTTYLDGEWLQPWEGKVGANGLMCVRAAIAAVVNNDSLSQLLQDSIALTGNVDTVAAIALAAASCSEEYYQDLPQHLIDNLENSESEYGRDYIMSLDRKLINLVRRSP